MTKCEVDSSTNNGIYTVTTLAKENVNKQEPDFIAENGAQRRALWIKGV